MATHVRLVQSRAGPTRRCAAPARKLTVVRAEQQKTQSKPPTDPKDDKPDPKKGPHLKKDLETISAEDRKEVDDAIKQLKEQGVDSAVAQKVRAASILSFCGVTFTPISRPVVLLHLDLLHLDDAEVGKAQDSSVAWIGRKVHGIRSNARTAGAVCS